MAALLILLAKVLSVGQFLIVNNNNNNNNNDLFPSQFNNAHG